MRCITLLSLLFVTVAHGAEPGHISETFGEYSAVVPLTLEHTVMRVRAKPPDGVDPNLIDCDIAVSGAVLTAERGVPYNDEPQTVVRNLLTRDNVDVHFSDRVQGRLKLDGQDSYRGINYFDMTIGLNIKYRTKTKVAQLELRPGYVLPSGDREGLSYSLINRKIRQLKTKIRRCHTYAASVADLQRELAQVRAAAGNANSVQYRILETRARGLNGKINKATNYAKQRPVFERDLKAFHSLNEYLRAKVHGAEVFIKFEYDGEVIPVDVDELRKIRVVPIRLAGGL